MKATGISLWLMPEGKMYEELASLIKKLAERNNAPIFQPHVTLLGEIKESQEAVISKTQKIAKQHTPFTVSFTHIDFEDYFFRALFLKAQKSDVLSRLNSKTREVFAMSGLPPYMPHLSLLYGDFLTPLKENIIRELGREQQYSFLVNAISVVHSQGEAREWKVIEKIPLG